MKILKIIFCILFAAIILIPVFNFDFTPNATSEIDNRNLAENPFKIKNEVDLTTNFENYINDRIGFRNDMITAYTVLNDKVFGEMVHPMYTYGKDGYVFASGLTTALNKYSDFHEEFARMVRKIQTYCEERNVPFVFVFNPAKPAVLEEYVNEGINYDRSWVDEFFKKLDELNVNYVDNTKVLRESWKKGNIVFNQKYDANHWNDLGAFYGTNAILGNLKNQMPDIHINSLKEFVVEEVLQTSLLVSKFPIKEKVPDFVSKKIWSGANADFSQEVERHSSYQGFGYFINESRKKDGAPNALVFQGSYMNTAGYKFLANSFSEYVYVHDYQNILNFDYYYNIFKPDCVVFEVAEYTFSDTYFNYEKMKQFELQPLIANISFKNKLSEKLKNDDLFIEKGKVLTKINWITNEQFDNVWLILDEEYDMTKNDNGYCVTVQNTVYNENKDYFKIVSFGNTVIKEYS